MTETLNERLFQASGFSLSVTLENDDQKLVIRIRRTDGALPDGALLHWGLNRNTGAPWQTPPDSVWPAGTVAFDVAAVRTPLSNDISIRIPKPHSWRGISFVIFVPKENRWIKDGVRDFFVELPKGNSGLHPVQALDKWAPEAVAFRQAMGLEGGDALAVGVQAIHPPIAGASPEAMRVTLVTDAAGPLLLHWGLASQFRNQWDAPPESARPAGTKAIDDKAVQSPFVEREGLRSLTLDIKAKDGGPRGLNMVFHRPSDNAWLKVDGRELHVPLFADKREGLFASQELWSVAEEIIDSEMVKGSWTLMHRFNLCTHLMGSHQENPEAMALFFAWLRYSAIRQLDWQRRFNTKPRELSHSQSVLTMRLAEIWRRFPQCRMWARLALTTVGRGGEGQQVRDEILHIMHRNHLKEVRGTFIEEWHQKLHNNTTPDDVVICEAYLAFLNSNGDKGVFYKTLEKGGVTRERLKSFERAIVTDPEFHGDKKGALVGEFNNFLRILKSVHAGADLETANAAAWGVMDAPQREKMNAIFQARKKKAPPMDLAKAATAAREGLAGAIVNAGNDGVRRDLLYLDLALEETVRGAIERQNLSQLDRDTLAELVRLTARNNVLSVDDAYKGEFALAANHWEKLLKQPHDGKEWALHAKSVADRLARAVQNFTDAVYRALQPKAEFLGKAFRAADWTIPLFSEEIVRGGPAFALSMVLRNLNPILRKAAGLGGWQVISPAEAVGTVRVVESLIKVQTETFNEPTVLVTESVGGDEEIPANVTSVITTSMPDLVSHVAVRARNAHVLFATCFDREEYDKLAGFKGKALSLAVTPGGDILYEPAKTVKTEKKKTAVSTRKKKTECKVPTPKAWAVAADAFNREIVGGKSNNLTGLRGKLGEWIRFPASIAMPYGNFERALADPKNSTILAACQKHLKAAEDHPTVALEQLRKTILELSEPAGLKEEVLAAWTKAGLPAVPWDQVWRTIKRVWASKWNERAYLSRRARNVPHEELLMAVLIQQVVEADYAFVIHTANPLTGNKNEVYAEVVLGLGETLVGNYPGRALGFTFQKKGGAIDLRSIPGKSEGLYGKGVIFRSDSNGEDLEGFAGAGLYDSYLAEEPQHRPLDYTNEKLLWDAAFREELLKGVAKVGLEVEKACGSAQDIEGAVSGGKFYVVQTRPQVGLK